jgi:hypothetical protein
MRIWCAVVCRCVKDKESEPPSLTLKIRFWPWMLSQMAGSKR